MLTNARAVAIIPVSSFEKGIEYYRDKLGLPLEQTWDDLPQNREARFTVGSTALGIYESVGAGQSRHTLAALEVDDFDETIADMRKRGVVFEEYDMPGMKTEDGVATIGEEKAAWFKDPDGNILVVAARVPARKPAAV